MPIEIEFLAVAPEAFGPLLDGAKLLAQSGLEPSLLVLVDLYASQLNGCAFCTALHTREGQALGEAGDRLSGVCAWQDASSYTARERAALEWTKAVTFIADERDKDELLDRLTKYFNHREIVYLTLAIVLINSWNRFNIAFSNPPEGAEAVFNQLHPDAELARG